MAFPIPIKTSNYVAGSGNKYVYNFPTTVEFLPNSKIGIQYLSMYNSTFNISSAIGNNTISIIWNADTSTTYNFTLSNGYYSGEQLNYALQQQMIANNLFVTSNNGSEYVYFIELDTNTVQYKFQINTYQLPTSAQASTLGYAKPSDATWNFPSSATSPQLTINSGIGTLLGFKETLTFPATSSSATSSFLSDNYPLISPIDAYNITCSLINNKYSAIPNLLSTISLNAEFGERVTQASTNMVYIPVTPGRYNQVTITFLDNDYNALTLNDPTLTLLLSVIE